MRTSVECCECDHRTCECRSFIWVCLDVHGTMMVIHIAFALKHNTHITKCSIYRYNTCGGYTMLYGTTVTRSLYHRYATPLPSFTPRFPRICVRRSATFFRTRPRVTISEVRRFAVERVVFFLVQTEKEIETPACAPHFHTRRAGCQSKL